MKQKTIRAALALIMAAVLAFISPANAFAEAKPALYIKDIMVGMGETADEAKKALTDAGFTVLDQNLNEGAGSAFKTEKFVYLGYKTTPVAADAITDLAVMNMSGGYSFTDYQALMDKYRDSQVRPFIDKFIATIKEYRENYYSEIPGNKSKADFAYSVLSQILEDDTGSNMGDLLLNPTREELGLSDEAYKALSRKEKAKTVDLTTAIMQGNTQVVCLMEQMLAIAADTNEKTWLERLSELGPDGLMEQYALKGIRPAEAEKEMAAQYIDTAKKMLNGWVDLRTDLLEYDAEFKATGGETTGEAEKIDLSKDKEFEIPKIDKDREGRDPATMTADDAVASIGTISRMMEHGAKLAEETEGSDIAGIYYVLNALPYGEGTL